MHKLSLRSAIVVTGLALPAGAAIAGSSQTLVYFKGGADGGSPRSTLISDAAGNLYGTTVYGGPSNYGTAFELSPPMEGQTAWTKILLANFTGKNGELPTAGLVADAAGNLYGTTNLGGAYGFGTVFELTRPVAGQTVWTESVLHSFNRKDGAYLNDSLIFDGHGNLYGTAASGGNVVACPRTHLNPPGCGVVFRLSPPHGNGTTWKKTVLATFVAGQAKFPDGNLVVDHAGNLYGTALEGGTRESGTVFEVSPPAHGGTSWTVSKLADLANVGLAAPAGGLIFDPAGNLYGTASGGGTSGIGGVVELSPPAAGQAVWTTSVLHEFAGPDGNSPQAELLRDHLGHLYGTTISGGTGGGVSGSGTVFELSPPARGMAGWTEAVLVSFDYNNGADPEAGLLADAAGNLYGTTTAGYLGYGSVFKLTP